MAILSIPKLSYYNLTTARKFVLLGNYCIYQKKPLELYTTYSNLKNHTDSQLVRTVYPHIGSIY